MAGYGDPEKLQEQGFPLRLLEKNSVLLVF